MLDSRAGVMDVCLLWLLCVVQLEVSGSGRSVVQGSSSECVCLCVCVIECDEVQQPSSAPKMSR
jgi:hypothetical protein